jgi:hypothetical protein
MKFTLETGGGRLEVHSIPSSMLGFQALLLMTSDAYRKRIVLHR